MLIKSGEGAEDPSFLRGEEVAERARVPASLVSQPLPLGSQTSSNKSSWYVLRSSLSILKHPNKVLTCNASVLP